MQREFAGLFPPGEPLAGVRLAGTPTAWWERSCQEVRAYLSVLLELLKSAF